MPAITPSTQHDAIGTERAMKPALLRGWRGRCPQCGQGRLLKGYLAVEDHCPACGEAFHHHRADDGPAYATVLIVGHVLVPLLLVFFVHYRPAPLLLATLFSVLAIVMSLLLLPRLKGLFVAVQWAKRMHGFGGEAA